MTDPVSTELRSLRRTYRLQRRKCSISVGANNFDRLYRAACKRDIDPLVLLERIVAAVIDGDLINAVLDDE